MLMNMNAHGQLQRDAKHHWGCDKIKKQESNPTRKINHWWIKRPDLERMVKWSKDTPTSTECETTNVH